jgi:hypothetical protein
MLGRDTRDREPDYGRGGGRHSGDRIGSGGGGKHQSGGKCSIVLGGLVAAPAALVTLAVVLVRRTRR